MGVIGIGIDIGTSHIIAKAFAGALLSCGSIDRVESLLRILGRYHGRGHYYLTTIYVLLASKSWQARRISFAYFRLTEQDGGVALLWLDITWVVERGWWEKWVEVLYICQR
jgi:hypothetical protein